MSIPLVRRAFEVPLAAYAATKSMEVGFDNVKFDPPAALHLRAYLLPAGTGSDDLAGEHRRYEGTFQVTVMAPAGEGANAAEVVAGEIADLFPINAPLQVDGRRVVLLSPMSQAAGQQEAAWYSIPVSCAYRLDTI